MKNFSEIRLEICSNCEQYDKNLKLCKECGCFMPWKVKLAPACCPLLKWTHVTNNQN